MPTRCTDNTTLSTATVLEMPSQASAKTKATFAMPSLWYCPTQWHCPRDCDLCETIQSTTSQWHAVFWHHYWTSCRLRWSQPRLCWRPWPLIFLVVMLKVWWSHGSLYKPFIFSSFYGSSISAYSQAPPHALRKIYLDLWATSWF